MSKGHEKLTEGGASMMLFISVNSSRGEKLFSIALYAM
jgi:hypothetical protein